MGLNEKIPNQLLNLSFMTTEEILGKGGLSAVLRYAGLDKFIGNYPPPDFEMVYPLSDMTRFFTSTLGLFGERGARPILFRGGKKAFDLILEFFPDLVRLDKTKSPEKKFEEFVTLYGNAIEAWKYIYGDVFTFYECPEGATLEISPCFWCQGIKTEKPFCHPQVGFSHSFLQWVVGGEVKVEETKCTATGDPMCRFVMYRP